MRGRAPIRARAWAMGAALRFHVVGSPKHDRDRPGQAVAVLDVAREEASCLGRAVLHSKGARHLEGIERAWMLRPVGRTAGVLIRSPDGEGQRNGRRGRAMRPAISLSVARCVAALARSSMRKMLSFVRGRPASVSTVWAVVPPTIAVATSASRIAGCMGFRHRGDAVDSLRVARALADDVESMWDQRVFEFEQFLPQPIDHRLIGKGPCWFGCRHVDGGSCA